MAAPPNPTVFIPPPPLPQFYLPRKEDKIRERDQERLKSSSSSFDGPDNASEQQVANGKPSREQKYETMGQYTYVPAHTYNNQALHVTEIVKDPPIPVDGMNEMHRRVDVSRMTPTQFIALQPRVATGTNNVPPLAIYHICRICLRPRSNRYHYEHPIPPNGVPPPPGICRRCRVRSVKESEVTEVEFHKESNEIKIGLQCIIPNADYISFEEMKEWKRRRFLLSLDRAKCDKTEETSEHDEGDKVISYRHVCVRSVSQTSSRRSLAQAPLSEANKPPIGFRPHTTVVSTAQDAIDAVSEAPVQASATVKVSSKIASRPTPEHVEAHIRKIAREEVERYRQAERKMEIHGGCYAHGRMVPVEPSPHRDITEEAPDKNSREQRPISTKEAIISHEPTEKARTCVPGDQHPIQREKEYAHPGRLLHRPDRVTQVIIKDRVAIDTVTQQRDQHQSERQRAIGQVPMSPPKVEKHPPSVKQHDEGGELSTALKPTLTNAEISYRRVTIEPLIPDHDIQILKKPEREMESAHHMEQSDSSWSGKTDQEYWYGEGGVLTGSGIAKLEKSQKTYRGQATPSEIARGPTSLSDRVVRSHGIKQNNNYFSRMEDAEESQHSTQTIRPGSQYVGDSSVAGVTSSPQRHGRGINDAKDEVAGQKKDSMKNDRAPKANDSEYFYARRTTEPVRGPISSSVRDGDRGCTQVETRELWRRRRQPVETGGVFSSRNRCRQEKEPGTGSDTSRVRFANKVEFSPTPPGSDASSTHFRQIGRQAQDQMDGYRGSENGNDLIETYERRGRVRDRAPTGGREFYVRGTAEHKGESWEVGTRPLARALSESPSRERLNAIARHESKAGPHSSKRLRQIEEWAHK